MRAWYLLAVNVACGEVYESPDASVGADAAADAPSDAAPACFGKPFTSASTVAGVNSAMADEYLRLSTDELTGYFSRAATPFTIKRTAASQPFGAPTPLVISGLGTSTVYSMALSGDGMTVYFSSDRSGGAGGSDIWRATRTSPTSDFGQITNVTELNSAADENDVYVTPDNASLYVSSTRNLQLGALFQFTVTGGVISAPVLVLDSPTQSINRAVVSNDGLWVIAQRAGSQYEWRRTSAAQRFGQEMELVAINSPTLDHPSWVSADGCRFYFASDRSGGSGGLDIYVAVRTP